MPVFSKDWWLDAVCGEENWDVSLVENDGEIIASLPYYTKKKLGVKAITMPKLTQNAGIRIKYRKEMKEEYKHVYEKEIINKLLDKLPDLPIFRQNFHYSFNNWQTLCWRGFNQTTFYTYVIEDLRNLEAVFGNFSKTTRKNIRKAEKIVQVYSNDSIEDFCMINQKIFERQGIRYPYSLDFLKRLDGACVQNNSRKIFFAKDEKGQIYSAIYIVWDEDSAYLLMSGSPTDLRHFNCKTLLVWEAIKFAATVTKKFDFEGSMVERIAEYNRQFGAIPIPYSYIFKEKHLIAGFSNVYNLLNRVK